MGYLEQLQIIDGFLIWLTHSFVAGLTLNNNSLK
jgi:hypothetical protein